MPKQYTIERRYKESEENDLFTKLKEIREKQLLIYQEDQSSIGTKYGFLVNKPDLGCFLQLTYFLREATKRVEAAVTALNEDKPQIVNDLEEILGRQAEVVNLK